MMSQTELEMPLLRHGDHPTRDEFMRRWEAMPNLKFAELIAGVPCHDDIAAGHQQPEHAAFVTMLAERRLKSPS